MPYPARRTLPNQICDCSEHIANPVPHQQSIYPGRPSHLALWEGQSNHDSPKPVPDLPLENLDSCFQAQQLTSYYLVRRLSRFQTGSFHPLLNSAFLPILTSLTSLVILPEVKGKLRKCATIHELRSLRPAFPASPLNRGLANTISKCSLTVSDLFHFTNVSIWFCQHKTT